MDATRTIDLLEETWRSVLDVGHQLGPDDWELPTDCPGWTVKDHVSHLIGTERFLEGLPPADVDPGERAYVKNFIGEANEREVEARRGTSGPAVLAELEDLVDQRLTTLRRKWADVSNDLQDYAIERLQSRRRTIGQELELGTMRRALLALVRDVDGVGTHDPDGHLLVFESRGRERRQRG